MSAQQGQTDEILKIKLTSQLLGAAWLHDSVPQNGKAGLEVKTQYVGEGAPIKITYKDMEGKAIGTQEGKVVSNIFRTLYAPSAANATGGVTFEVDMPKHSLKRNGGKLKVGKPIEFSALRFIDATGKKALTEILEGKPAGCEAKVKGMDPHGKVVISVYFRTNWVLSEGALLVEAHVPVKDGKATLFFDPNIKNRMDRVKIQKDLDKEGGTYLQPEFTFAVSAFGVRAVSEPAKAVQTLTLHFWEFPGDAGSLEGKSVTITGPDGKKEKKTIPKDGNITVKKAKGGKHQLTAEKGVAIKPDSPPTEKKYTDSPNEVLAQKTKPTPREVVKMLLETWSELKENGARTLTAQFMHETGNGNHCYNWNLGNVKGKEKYPHHYLKNVWEIKSREVAKKDVSEGNGLAKIADAELKKKKGWTCPAGKEVVVYQPDHKEAMWHSYTSLQDGAEQWINHHKRTQTKNHKYITRLNEGDCSAVAKILKETGYYTADESDYANGMTKIKKRIDNELGAIP